MKKLLVLSLICTASVGCMSGKSFLSPTAAADRSARGVSGRPAYRAPIVAGEISAENAKNKAKALDEELDRELEKR